jgi:hypothetical protein
MTGHDKFASAFLRSLGQPRLALHCIFAVPAASRVVWRDPQDASVNDRRGPG